jgi:CheY-like chemotaxis protein
LFQEPSQAARINGGTGLGLYSLAKRVEALGGYYGMEMRSRGIAAKNDNLITDEVKGSKFWFIIPNIITHPTVCKSDHGKMIQRQSSSDGPPMSAQQQQQDAVKDFEKDKDLNSLNVTATIRHQGFLDGCVSGRSVDCTLMPSWRAPSGGTTCSTLAPNQTTTKKEHEIVTIEPNVALDFVPILTEPSRPLRVLIVDDSPAIVKMTSLALKKHGYDVITAENGLIAFEMFRKELLMNRSKEHDRLSSATPTSLSSIDVILMDFQMPIMDGIEAIREIRTFEQDAMQQLSIQTNSQHYRPCVIIGFSAKSDEYQIEEAYLHGMDDFLSKPFSITSFKSILSSLSNKTDRV